MENKNKNTKSIRAFIGEVISHLAEKTAVVKVDVLKMHSKYKKTYRVSKKFHVHDEKNEAKVGDKVKFVECRPLSKTKRWRLAQVIKETK
jgi:small subunit ribosomal protein S17